MTLTKSLLSVFAALALSTGAAFAGSSLSSSYDAGGPELLGGPEMHAQLDSLEAGDRAHFAQSEGAMTDPFDVYYIVPMEVVEVEKGFLLVSDVPSERTIYFFKPGHRGYVPAEVLNCQHCRGIGTDRGDQANAQVHCGHEVEPFNVLPAAFREAVAALTATQPETPREL